MRFRGSEVLARCDASGALRTERGLVEFRYQPDGKSYRTRPDRLEIVADAQPRALPEGEPRSPKARARAPRAKGSGKKATRWASSSASRGAERAIQLWTDGACSGNPGPAGLGVRFEHKGEVVEASEFLGEGTNNIAELSAILRALQMVEAPSTPVDVLTDSTYCIGLLTQGWKAKKNKALVAELRETLSAFDDVRLIKVPAHSGVTGNERADALAREAVETGASRTERIA